jgi:hypothetical protein
LVRSSEEKGNLRGKGEGSDAKEQRGKALRKRSNKEQIALQGKGEL